MDRRIFLKQTSFTAIAGAALPIQHAFGAPTVLPTPGKYLSIKSEIKSVYHPFDDIIVNSSEKLSIKVVDGAGRIYIQKNIDENLTINIGGALGIHQVNAYDKKSKLVDSIQFFVDTQTSIEDEDNEFTALEQMLRFTMSASNYGVARVVRLNGKTYQYFSSWFQDHMYVMLGMRYFYPDLKSGVDLYTEGQREDGMIHDNYKHEYQHDGSWSRRFDYGNFVTVPKNPDSSCVFVRVPVENIAEFTYLEAIYLTWKATGDSDWMRSKLDSALKAVQYATTDPYRWSEEYQLLKRGYTIDIWDFQSEYDTEIAGDDTMRVYLDKTEFGIMYGDNVRFAASCGYLAEMLNYAKRKDESEKIAELGLAIKNRIDKLAWNGNFYTHHIPLNPGFQRDFGSTNTDEQVTLSNAWALNHGVTHEQAKKIIKTYQRIQNEMPESSPGEWYCCYPPFEKGFSHTKWNYMNGGVSPIAAGELALGAFNHGFESYGIDILRRIYTLAQKTGNIIEGCYKGKMPEEPNRNFNQLDLRKFANCDIKGDSKAIGWTGEGDNDLHKFPTGFQIFEGIPYNIIKPVENRSRVCIGLSKEAPYHQQVVIPVNKKTASIYFLHTKSGDDISGVINLIYADGTTYSKYVKSGSEIGNWWEPSAPEPKTGIPKLRVAWIGSNNHAPKVGVYQYGMNNPHPEKEIKSITLEGSRDATRWMILGITLCDAKVFFMPTIVSTIPRHWAAAECYYALMEGMAGIKDTGVSFSKAVISPKWSFADKNKASITAKYEASNGYVAYKFENKKNIIELKITGSSNQIKLEVPVPVQNRVEYVTVDDASVPFNIEAIEQSKYVKTEINIMGSSIVKIILD